LCMIGHLPAMIGTGIRALKIEGRMKGIHYAATAVKTYREAIDTYYSDPDGYALRPYWQQELDKITSRGYCSGFYLDESDQAVPSYTVPQPPTHALAGKVLSPAGKNRAYIEVRNQIRKGDAVEIVKPSGPAIHDRIQSIVDNEGQNVEIAHPASRATVELTTDCQRLDLLRRVHPSIR